MRFVGSDSFPSPPSSGTLCAIFLPSGVDISRLTPLYFISEFGKLNESTIKSHLVEPLVSGGDVASSCDRKWGPLGDREMKKGTCGKLLGLIRVVSLQTQAGRFVSAQLEDGKLLLESESVDSLERFKIEYHVEKNETGENTSVSLKSAHGKNITAFGASAKGKGKKLAATGKDAAMMKFVIDIDERGSITLKNVGTDGACAYLAEEDGLVVASKSETPSKIIVNLEEPSLSIKWILDRDKYMNEEARMEHIEDDFVRMKDAVKTMMDFLTKNGFSHLSVKNKDGDTALEKAAAMGKTRHRHVGKFSARRARTLEPSNAQSFRK